MVESTWGRFWVCKIEMKSLHPFEQAPLSLGAARGQGSILQWLEVASSQKPPPQERDHNPAQSFSYSRTSRRDRCGHTVTLCICTGWSAGTQPSQSTPGWLHLLPAASLPLQPISLPVFLSVSPKLFESHIPFLLTNPKTFSSNRTDFPS